MEPVTDGFFDEPKETALAECAENQLATMDDPANGTLWNRAVRLSRTTLVPTAFQGKPDNCLLAMELANRLNLPAIMVMGGIYVTNGRPSWEAKFLAAISNASGRFTSIRHKMTGTKGQDDYGCIAYFTDKETKETIEGPEVTMAMAKGLGWTKNPHWAHGCEYMLRYRAESFLVKTTAPELMCGLQTREEREDVEINVTPRTEKSAVEAAWEATHE